MKLFMKKVSKSLLLAPLLIAGIAVATPALVHAQGCDDVTTGISGGADCAKPTNAAEDLFGENSIFQTVTNILLFLIGAISVIMLIVGGIRYVVSGGDQNAITSAKNTILYAIIGIVVAFLAFAAVRFVTEQLKKSTSIGSHVAVVRQIR